MFSPTNYTEAFQLMFADPSYGIKDISSLKEVAFEDYQIIKIERFPGQRRRFLVHFKTAKFHGYFMCFKIPENFPFNEIGFHPGIFSKYHLHFLLSRLYEYIPNATIVFATMFILIISDLISFSQIRLVPVFWPAKEFVSSTCSIQCVEKGFQVYATTLFLLLPTIGALAFAILFYRWRRDKIRNSSVLATVRIESYLMISVLLIVGILTILRGYQTGFVSKLIAVHQELNAGQAEMSSKKGI